MTKGSFQLALVVVGCLIAVLCGGCEGVKGDDGAGGDTNAEGVVAYQDSDTNSSGDPQQPASPEPQPASDPMRVDIRVSGGGTLEGVDVTCLDGASGMFEGLYAGEGTIGDNGVYAAAFASTTASFETPSGCDIPSLQVGAVTNVVVRAELSATTKNCQSYCSAKARSTAEAECQSGADQASCRAASEASYESACTTECTSQTHRIVAETSLSASAVAELSARNLTGAALGELYVDLTFDRVEDDGGNTVSEAP